MKLEANLIIKRSGSSLRPRSNFIFADDDDDNEDDNDNDDDDDAEDDNDDNNDDDNDGEHKNDGDNDRLLPGPRSNFLLALLWNTEYIYVIQRCMFLFIPGFVLWFHDNPEC